MVLFELVKYFLMAIPHSQFDVKERAGGGVLALVLISIGF
jgi:hypothetical protein